jgi:hypothetical protein
VHSRFSQFVKAEMSDNVTLISPEQPWSAIARGAAMRWLDEKPPVTIRRARDSIGVVVETKFEDGMHDVEDLVECPKYGRRAANQIHWLVKRVGLEKSCQRDMF